jgi:hypothetical protein
MLILQKEETAEEATPQEANWPTIKKQDGQKMEQVDPNGAIPQRAFRWRKNQTT